MQLTDTLNDYMKTQKWQVDQSSSQKKRKGRFNNLLHNDYLTRVVSHIYIERPLRMYKGKRSTNTIKPIFCHKY